MDDGAFTCCHLSGRVVKDAEGETRIKRYTSASYAVTTVPDLLLVQASPVLHRLPTVGSR